MAELGSNEFQVPAQSRRRSSAVHENTRPPLNSNDIPGYIIKKTSDCVINVSFERTNKLQMLSLSTKENDNALVLILKEILQKTSVSNKKEKNNIPEYILGFSYNLIDYILKNKYEVTKVNVTPNMCKFVVSNTNEYGNKNDISITVTYDTLTKHFEITAKLASGSAMEFNKICTLLQMHLLGTAGGRRKRRTHRKTKSHRSRK
jgi:hypothetical protein